MSRALIAICFWFFAACATTNKGDLDALKPTLNAFHGHMRWKDYSQLPMQLVPERREAFIRGLNARDDDKNLVVTDYQLEECDVKPEDQKIAVCVSKISWYRLPSPSVTTATVATTLRWQGGMWLVDRQSGGPFAEELSVGGAQPARADGGN
jgi:hypothetical protein